MKYRILGKSTLKISEIGFGSMSLAQEELLNSKLLHAAIENGINFFDTADLYQHGENENQVGKALQAKRKEIVLATKVGNKWNADGSGWEWKPEKEYILKAADESLRRLRTDYIDLYQLHGGTLEDPFEDIVDAFELLKKQGKILYYGISSIRPNVIRKYTADSSLSSVMTQYSLLDRRPEEQTLPLLQSHGIGVLARGALAQGLLVNKPAKEYLGNSPEIIENLTKQISELVAEKRNLASIPLHYVLSSSAVSSVVVGMRNIQQLDQILSAYESNFLTNEIFSTLKVAAPQRFYEQHR